MKTFGLIGKTLGHSFSKEYFTNKFDELQLNDHVYLNFELEKIEQFPEIIKNHPDLIGLNVTIPYKTSIIKYLDELDKDAKLTSAVNTIKIKREGKKTKLIGFNTDTYGFENSILPYLNHSHEKALVLGTGGAAKAITFILRKLGLSIQEISRTPHKPSQMSYYMITEELIKEHTLIINTTPLGMYPNINDYADIPYKQITSEHILFDLVYNPEETNFLKYGKENGAVTINGLKMLNLQADKSWEIWNETPGNQRAIFR